MTRANTEQIKHTPWFAKAGAACSIVPISRFVGANIFALKGGGYGCLFSLTGVDEEGLTDQALEARVRQIEGALRGLPEGSCLYQYTRVMSGFELPRQKRYENEATQTFADDRLAFLNKNAAFRRIDLHWCLTLEPSQVKAFARKPNENVIETSRMLSDLEKTATLLEGHLSSALGLRLLGKNEVFQFFSYLFNLEDWACRDQLRADTGVDRQIVNSPVAWHSDHVQIGQRHIQMFSLKTTPEASRPCLFSGLLTLDCDSVLCTTWRVKSASAARSEIDAQEKFISFFKVGVLTRVMSGRDTASLETGAGAKAANNNVDDLSEVIRALDKKAQGEFSLRLLLATRSGEQLHSVVPAVHRIFVDARAQVMEETLGNLSAFYAMFPGNHKFNVFPMWLAEDHHARLSSVFAPHIGHPRSDDLDSEYLNIFETRTRTPFFQDVYVDGVRVMLIIGPTGTGKSVHGNQIISLEQKYGGFTYIFDIGGSYESVVELYGGKVDRVGKDGPRVNPFSLEPTESNIKFLFSFIKLLLTNGGAELEPEDDDVIHKAVQGMYLLDTANRRLSNLFLPKKLDRYLSKWVGRGIYNAVFDNVVVTNHIDGGLAGPILIMLTTDYYSHDHQQLLMPQGTRVLVGFRNAYVFDVEQTEGAELPTMREMSGSVGDNRARLVSFIDAQGIELSFTEKIAPALGMSYGGKIAILPGQSEAEEFSTLVHELAHEMLHKAERRTTTTKVVRETEAEAIAFVIGKAGRTLTGVSLVTSWSQ